MFSGLCEQDIMGNEWDCGILGNWSCLTVRKFRKKYYEANVANK